MRSISVLPLREIVTLSSLRSPCAAIGQLFAANGMPASSFFKLHRLHDLSRVAARAKPKTARGAPGCLLTDDRNFRAMLAQISRDRQQQRTRSGNDHALAANWQTGLDHRLQASRSHHIRQRPARKRQKPLPRPRRHNQIRVAKLRRDLSVPSARSTPVSGRSKTLFP